MVNLYQNKYKIYLKKIFNITFQKKSTTGLGVAELKNKKLKKIYEKQRFISIMLLLDCMFIKQL